MDTETGGFFSRIFWRLEAKVEKDTPRIIAKLHESTPYRLYPDAAEAVSKVKKRGFKKTIVTTGTHFIVRNAVKPIRKYFDFIITGYEAGRDKSNPKRHEKVLGILGVMPHEVAMIGSDA